MTEASPSLEPRSVLAVYAHPDDPETAAGGTLARWSDLGADVHLVIATRGEKGSSDPDADTERLAATRRAETAAAAAVLGIASVTHLDHPDGAIDEDDARATICALVRRLRPDTVLCPDPTAVFFGDRYVNHRDHRVTGWATIDAVAPAAANPHYYPEQIRNGLAAHQVRALYCSGTLEPDTWVDIGTTIERKIDALFCHASQLEETGEWFRSFLRDRAAAEGQRAGIPAVTYSEGFRRVLLG